MRSQIKSTLLLFISILSYADESLTPRHLGGGITTVSNSRDVVKIGNELIDKKSAVFAFDMVNLKFGDPEKYGEDLVNIPPLKLKKHIYTRFHKEENRWVPDLAEVNGYFTAPDKFILPGSVVPGEWLGVPGKKFEFLKNKPNLSAWVVTDNPVTVYWSVLVGRTSTGDPIREKKIINPTRDAFVRN